MKTTIFVGLALALATVSQAQTASDNAGNSPYAVGLEYIQVGTPLGDQTAATNGMNGGFGFDRWQRGGYGTPPNNGTTLVTNLSPSFNMGSQQWGLRSGPGGVEGADARRRMVNDLPVGGSVSFSMMTGGNGAGQVNTSGECGVEIRSAALSNPGRDILAIYARPGQNWKLYAQEGDITTSLAATPGQRLDVKLTQIGSDVIRIDLTPFGGSTETHNVTNLSPGTLIRTTQFYCFNSDGDFYVNNLSANHDPSNVIVAPLTFSVALGKLGSGTAASLGAEDGNALTVCRFLVPNQAVPPVNVQFDGKSPITTCSALKLNVVTKMDTAGMFQISIELFNWTTNDWDVANALVANLNTNYSSHTLTATGTLSNYLKSSDGSLRARYRVKPVGVISSNQWCNVTDKATWSVTP